MAKAYSVDLRERVVADYDEGMRAVELIRRYRVSERWVYKLLKQRRETGGLEPLKGKAGRKPKLEGYRQELEALVGKRPDATLEELRRELPIPVCVTTVWKALKDFQITLKKSPARRGAAKA